MASHFAPQDKSKKKGGRQGAPASRYAEPPQRGLSTGKKVGIVFAVVLAVLLVAGGTSAFLLYRSAMTVRAQASEIMAQVDPMKEALKSGDAETLDSSVGTVQENMAAINAEVHTPLWTLASFVPVVGEDVRSVQALGDAGSALVNDALVPVAKAVSGTGLSDLLQDGVVNVELVRTIADSVSGALPTIQSSIETISSLPEPHIPQLKEVLGKVQEPLSSASGLVEQLGPMLELLPQMLGGDGARTYLVIAQNNSELRSTGGLPGAWGTLTIDNGVISMGEFTTVVNGEGFNVPVLDEEVNHLGWTLGTNAAQMTYTPNFVRTGEIASEYWRQAGYGDVDGVISVDPVFLQRLLSLTGGFTAPDGTVVDGTNAAKVLLSDTYWRFGNDGDAQDAFFGSIAALAFKNVMGNLGNAGMTDLMDVIEASAEDGRLSVWMANEEEEAAIGALGLTGEIGADPTQPELGVYLNDATWSKIDWYMSSYTQIGEGVKNADGTTSYSVTTTLTNTLTSDVAATAPEYVVGYNPQKRDASDMLTYVYLFAPAGGSISDVAVEGSGSANPFVEATAYGLPIKYALTSLLAGQSLTFTYTVTTSAEATEPLSLRTTPLAQEGLAQAPTA